MADGAGSELVRGNRGHAAADASSGVVAPVSGPRASTAAHAPASTRITLRLADGSEADCRAGIHLAREAHGCTIFQDISFSDDKTRAIYAKAMARPERFGLIYAVPGGNAPLAEGGLMGFASVHAGEHFLGHGTLIATV